MAGRRHPVTGTGRRSPDTGRRGVLPGAVAELGEDVCELSSFRGTEIRVNVQLRRWWAVRLRWRGLIGYHSEFDGVPEFLGVAYSDTFREVLRRGLQCVQVAGDCINEDGYSNTRRWRQVHVVPTQAAQNSWPDYGQGYSGRGVMYQQERHRGRGRGGRGRGRGRGSGWRGAGQSDQGRGPPRGPGRSYPAGLRGKEIGLFFARKNSAQNKWAQKNQRVALSIDPESQQELRHIIRGIRSEEGEGHERIDAINSVALDYLEGHGSGSSSAWGSPGHVTGAGLTRNPTLDERFRKDLEVKAGSPDFKKMLEFRKLLPAYKMKQQIVDLIESNQVVVISGETGSGKTTQIPQFILDTYINEGRGSTCRVICTQPRRISAITVAERVAAERGERCGDASAGYQIRLECRLPRDRGSILFCTTGILLQQLQSDPYIASASHVILDEVHERDLQTDFLAIVLKDLLTVRPDLRVVLMSATINADLFSRYFGNCPMLEIPGIAYPVEVHYLEDVLEFTRYRGNSGFEGRSQVRRRDQGRFQDAMNEQMPFLRSLEGRWCSKMTETNHIITLAFSTGLSKVNPALNLGSKTGATLAVVSKPSSAPTVTIVSRPANKSHPTPIIKLSQRPPPTLSTSVTSGPAVSSVTPVTGPPQVAATSAVPATSASSVAAPTSALAGGASLAGTFTTGASSGTVVQPAMLPIINIKSENNNAEADKKRKREDDDYDAD
ncbi:ATP-dependent DNA/RNA helicase DHX36 [Ixodes scapularis]